MSQYSHVTDDLLSAYLDDAVTASERTLVETAVANDPDIAWRLMTLRYTVDLLGKLPEIPLPRSFILSEAMAAEAVVEPTSAQAPRPAPHPRLAVEPQPAGFWASWRSFWQGGNLFLRNAAAASLAAFIVLAVGGFAFAPGGASSPAPASESVAFQSAGPSEEVGAVSSVQSQADAQIQVEPPPSLAVAAAPASSDDAAEVVPASQTQQAAARVAPSAAPASAESAPAPPSQPAEVPAAESAAEAAPAAAQSQAETSTPTATEVVMAAAVAALIDAQNAAAEKAAASDETPTLLQEQAAQSATLTSTRTGEVAATDLVTALVSTLVSAPLAAASEANGPAEETTSVEEAAPASMAEAEDAEPAPPVVADKPIDQSADESPLPAGEQPAESAPAVALASAPESAAAVAEKSAPAAVAVTTASQPASSGTTETTPLQYLQLIALALALLFASLWLLSRRNASPSR